MSPPSVPRELVYAIARAAWVADDDRERRERGVEREFDATAKPEALEVMATLVEAFVEEATHRACALATLEGARGGRRTPRTRVAAVDAGFRGVSATATAARDVAAAAATAATIEREDRM